MSTTFQARYPGICGNCDERFPIGEVIRYEGIEVVHADCGGALPKRPDRPVCPKCWLAHAGECF